MGACARALVLLAALALPQLAAAACPLGQYASATAVRNLCPFKDGLARIEVGQLWGFVDPAGQVAIAPRFDYVEDFSEGYAVAWAGDFKGLIDRRGNWVVPARFTSLGRVEGGLAAASLPYRDGDGGRAGYIDPAGKWAIAPTYDTTNDFVGALAMVASRGAYMFIDRKGSVLKRMPGEVRITLHDNPAPLVHATTRDATLLVHLDGRRLPLPEGADPGTYWKQHLVAMKEVDHEDHMAELKGLVDMHGKWVVPPSFAELKPYFGKLAIASAEKLGPDGQQVFGLVDKYGQFVAPPAYVNIARERDGSFRARRALDATRVDHLDPNGKLRSTRICPKGGADRRCNDFVDDGPRERVALRTAVGLTPTKRGSYWGLRDRHGRWSTPPTLPAAPRPFFRKRKLIGWTVAIDKFEYDKRGLDLIRWLGPRGNLVAGKAGQYPVRYDRASNTLIVTQDDRYDSVVSVDGAQRIGPMYAALKALGDGWFVAEARTLHGLIDQRGEWRIAPRAFDMSIDFGFRNGGARPYMWQHKGGDRELMDLNGKISTRAAPRELRVDEPSASWWADNGFKEPGHTSFRDFTFKTRVRVPGEALANEFSEGVIGFTPSDPALAGQIGLIDDTGRTLGLYRHESIEPMRDGMAITGVLVSPERTRYGYLDRAGKLTIPARFDAAGDFARGRATVFVDNTLALIDKTGRVLLQGGWLCGKEKPAILDGRNNVIWPPGATVCP